MHDDGPAMAYILQEGLKVPSANVFDPNYRFVDDFVSKCRIPQKID